MPEALLLAARLVAGIGLVSLAPAIALCAGAGALSTLVADSDVEHFADVIAELLAYPIGWPVEAQTGLEATPVGLAYHYVHAAIGAVTGHDTLGTAAPSHLAMVALAPAGILAPAAPISEGGEDLAVRYVNLSAGLVSTAARPHQQRLGAIPRVVTLRDAELWRLPVGLPLE